MLVESDSHDVRLSGRLVWGAAEWIARCKGWKLEGVDGKEVEEWEMDEEDEEEEGREKAEGRRRRAGGGRGEGKGGGDGEKEVWTVRTLERNWARFMRLVD